MFSNVLALSNVTSYGLEPERNAYQSHCRHTQHSSKSQSRSKLTYFKRVVEFASVHTSTAECAYGGGNVSAQAAHATARPHPVDVAQWLCRASDWLKMARMSRQRTLRKFRVFFVYYCERVHIVRAIPAPHKRRGHARSHSPQANAESEFSPNADISITCHLVGALKGSKRSAATPAGSRDLRLRTSTHEPYVHSSRMCR